MEEIKINNSKNKFKRKLTIIVFYLLLGITSYLLFSYYLQYKKIITPLKPDEIKYEVSLSEGTLYFRNYTFGNEEEYVYDASSIYTKKVPIDEYIEYLDYDPRPKELKYLPKDTTTSPQILYYNMDNNLVNDNYKLTYSNDSGEKYVNIYVSKNKQPEYSPISDVKDIDLSTMINTKLKICYYRDMNWKYHFIAQFKYNNIGYTITSFNLSQEEFINTLYQFID